MLSLDMDLDVAVVYIAGFGVSERYSVAIRNHHYF